MWKSDGNGERMRDQKKVRATALRSGNTQQLKLQRWLRQEREGKRLDLNGETLQIQQLREKK